MRFRKTFILLLYILHFMAAPAIANNFVFTPINTTNGLSDNQIRHILQLSDGRMVFTTIGNVNIYDGAQFKYIHRNDEHIYPLKEYDGHYRIYQQGDSILWIKDQYKLMCIQLHSETYLSNLSAYFQKNNINTAVNDLFIDQHSRMWLLTPDGLLLKSSMDLFDISSEYGKLQDLIADHELLYLFFDTGKIVCYNIATKQPLYSKAAYPETELSLFNNTSLVVNGRRGIYQLRNGRKGGLFFFNTQTRAWETLLVMDYAFNTLIIDSNEIAYISSANGIWMVNPANGEQQFMPDLRTVKGDTISTEISTLFYDRQGGFWVGTLNRGLLYHHPSRFKLLHFGRAAFRGYAGKELIVQAFAEDHNGRIFIKTSTTIFELHPATNNLKPANTATLSDRVLKQLSHTHPPKTYQGKIYNALCSDSRGRIWAGTSDGLLLFNPAEQTRRAFYMNHGLSNNFVHAIFEDSSKRIWVTTSNGISQIQTDTLTGDISFINFNSFDGTLENEYVVDAIYEASDGRLFFGGIEGFNILLPEPTRELSLPYKPLFKELRLYGEAVKHGVKYDQRVILSKPTPYTDAIELAHYQNFLSFEFSALNFRNPTQTNYRYQLEGIDADWQEVSVATKSDKTGNDGILRLTYTNLPPGKYRLKVMSADTSLQWNENLTCISITILAPWWKTTLAYILYVLIGIMIAAATIHQYTRFSNKKLERQHKEEILLLRIRNLIEQCNQYENKMNSPAMKASCPAGRDGEPATPEIENANTEDAIFISRAMKLVENNLDNPDYSVEVLSRDLFMERTGLYRKLITLLDQSPSLFIRNIRLQRAAEFLLENKRSITEIAEIVGFSSTSYMSKCFQEMYGCRPSEYPAKHQKST